MANSPQSKFTSPLLMTNDQIMALGIDSEQVELFRRKEYQASFGMNTWYDRLKEHTFRTELLPFSYEEALAFLDKHYGPYAKKRVENNKLLLDQVQARIGECLTRFPTGAFIKLSTRSPKDVPVEHDAHELNPLNTLIRTEIEAIPEHSRDANSVCRAWVVATNKYLRVYSAPQAMELLLLSTRVAEDLGKLTAFGKAHFECYIAVREWNEEVPKRVAWEFRGFVAQNRLNALTQYYHFLHFPELIGQKKQIAARIQAFHDSIKSRIPHESYVIDFFVLPDDRVLVIELNPFHNGAGGCLFSWREHRDLFLNGPFEFRLQTDPQPIDTLSLLPRQWHRYIYNPHAAQTARQAAEADANSSAADGATGGMLDREWLWRSVAVAALCLALYAAFRKRSS